jgi:phosphoglycerol transferase
LTLELWRADLRVPFTYGADGLCVQLWVKGIVENGWYLKNMSIGAPFGNEMYDFPMADNLHFLGFRALSLLSRNYVVVLNVYYMATYFLCTFSALFVFRRFGVSRLPAVLCGLAFAFLPYHFHRGEVHIFLGSYFLVPLAVMVCLSILLEERAVPGGRAEEGPAGSRPWILRGIGVVVVALMIASGGVYYAFFTCFFLVVAGVLSALMRRRLLPLASAGLLIVLIACGVAANLTPSIFYKLREGPNPAAVQRDPAESELYGLRIAQLLLPVRGHRIEALRRLREEYETRPGTIENENDAATLGLVGSLGFLGLLGCLVLRDRGGPYRVRHGLAALNLAAVLLGTMGGLGSVFSYTVSPMIRCYNRISIFIGFFSLFAVALAASHVLATARNGRRGMLMSLGFVVLMGIGLLDQTTPLLAPRHETFRKRAAIDEEFVGRVEATLPAGSSVFQFPLVEFMEPLPPAKMGPYDHARAYLHSRKLRWSYAAMKGRAGDNWQKYAASQPTPEMLKLLAIAGFDGIYVDRAGYDDRGVRFEGDLRGLTGKSPLESQDRRLAFYDLSAFRSALKGQYSVDRWAALRKATLNPVTVDWKAGFYGREDGPDGKSWRWCRGYGEVVLANPWPFPRRIDLKMILATMPEKPMRVCIERPDGATAYTVDGGGVEVKETLLVPPGRITLRLGSAGETATVPGDPRTLAFRVERFALSESDGTDGPLADGTGLGVRDDALRRGGDDASGDPLRR